MKDFFVSYNRADRQWAEWIAWRLEEAGYAVIVQAWDIRPGSNFILEMDNAARETERTIAVLCLPPIYLRFTPSLSGRLPLSKIQLDTRRSCCQYVCRTVHQTGCLLRWSMLTSSAKMKQAHKRCFSME